jgi:hypothetical protein
VKPGDRGLLKPAIVLSQPREKGKACVRFNEPVRMWLEMVEAQGMDHIWDSETINGEKI